jgi:hypothetical protein
MPGSSVLLPGFSCTGYYLITSAGTMAENCAELDARRARKAYFLQQGEKILHLREKIVQNVDRYERNRTKTLFNFRTI